MRSVLSREDIVRFLADPPVDVEALSEHLGVKVWQSRALPENVSGKIFKDPIHGGSEGYSMVVNANDYPLRKRFTIAHELAHFLLHREFIGDGIEEDALYRSNRLNSRQELQANRLAADILMPWHLLNRYPTKDASELAKIFQVSAEAMRVRLGLNIIADRVEARAIPNVS